MENELLDFFRNVFGGNTENKRRKMICTICGKMFLMKNFEKHVCFSTVIEKIKDKK